MRMTVTISDEVLGELMTMSRAKTRTEAVNHAVGEWVRRQRLDQLKALRGRLDLNLDVEALRATEELELAPAHD